MAIRLLIILIMTTALFFSGCEVKDVSNVNDETNLNNEINTEESEEIPAETYIRVEPKVIAKDENGAKLNIVVPHITGMKDLGKQNEINEMFVEKGEALKNEVLEAEESLRNIDPNIFHAEGITNYQIKLHDDNVLSILLESYIYTGGAHGMPYRFSFNLDLINEEILTLKDMFEEGTDYIGLLSNEIKKQIEAQELDFQLFEPFEKIKEDQSFYITEDNLVIYFDVYEYTPYAAGFPEFQIDKDMFPSLKDVYNRKSEL